MITVNDAQVPHEPTMTVADLLRREERAPEMLAVWLDGELVPRHAYDTTPVPDGAQVQIVPIIAGG